MRKIFLPYKALLVLVLLGGIWGSGYSIAKYVISHGVNPLGYSFWQSLGPALVLALFCIVSGQKLPLARAYWPYILVCGFLGIALPNSNMYFIAPHLPAGLLALIVNTVPIITYALALLCKQETFDRLRFAGILLGFVGIIFIVAPHPHLSIVAPSPRLLLTQLTPISFSACAVFINQQQVDCAPLPLAAGMLLASTLCLLPLILTLDGFYPLSFPINLTDGLVLLEIALSSIGYVLFFYLIQTAGAVFYSLVGGVVALTGLFWGYIIFNERLSVWNFIATVLILLAILFVSVRQGKSHAC